MFDIVAENKKNGGPYRTQRDFLESVGFTYGNIGSLKKGERMPTIDNLQLLCKIHKIDGHWLLTGERNLAGANSSSLNKILSHLEQIQQEIKKGPQS